MNEIDIIRDRYRKLALDWHASKDVPRVANVIFKKHHALYKEIRESEEGAQVIVGLLDDPEPAVRLLAGTHALSINQAKAEKVLEDLEDEGTILATSAKYTLREFREGTLDLNW